MEYKNSLDKQYCELLKHILENGHISGDRTGTGTIKSFGYMIKHDMRQGFPILTTKKVFTKGIIHELLWFISGNTNIKYLVDNNVNIWVGDCYKRYKQYCELLKEPDYEVHVDDPAQNCTRILTEQEFIEQIKTNKEFANKWGELNKVYGSEWRDWYGIDQLQELIDTLKTNPDSRRMVVTAWNPKNVKSAVLPPCHNFWQVVTRELTWEEQVQWVMKNTDVELENLAIVEEIAKETTPKRAISLQFNMRSVDVPLGLPFDISSYGFLLSLIAQVVNMVPEYLSCTTVDTHIYQNQLDGVNIQLERDSHPLPKIWLNPDIKNLDDFKYDDIKLINYVSEDKINYPLSN